MDLYSIYLYLSSSQVWWGDTPRVNESNESAFMLVAISTKLHCVFDGVDANFMMKSAIFAPYHGKILPHIAMVLLYAAVRIWSCFFTKASSEFTCIARIGIAWHRMAPVWKCHPELARPDAPGSAEPQPFWSLHPCSASPEKRWAEKFPPERKMCANWSLDALRGMDGFSLGRFKASREIPWGIREIIHSYIIYHSYMSLDGKVINSAKPQESKATSASIVNSQPVSSS